MPYQRQFLATMGALFCMALAVVVLLQNRRSRLHRNFFAYNVCVAAWNLADLVVFPPFDALGVWHLRVVGLPAAFFVPFFIRFVDHVVSIQADPVRRKLEKIYFLGGAVFAGLHLTPLILRDVAISPDLTVGFREIPGPIYPAFALFLLSGLIAAVLPLPRLIRNGQGFQRRQATYAAIATMMGGVAVAAFLLSFFGMDVPWVYYTSEMLVCFIFAYAIFKHDLIPAQLAIRRFVFLFGLYLGMTALLLPAAYWFNRVILPSALPLGMLFGYTALIGVAFSLVPVAYAWSIRHTRYLQENAAELTHEFKSPLASIQAAHEILSSELKRAKPDAGRVQSYLDLVERNANRLHGFVSSYLELNRLSGQSEVERRTSVDLRALVRDVAQANPAVGGRLQMDDKGEAMVRGNEEGLRQVVANLLSNCAKYAPAGPIVVDIRAEKREWIMAIQDRGPGLDPSRLRAIFDPYVRIRRPGTTGSGLGLSIVKRWADLHGGRAWAESDGEGKGATFFVALPAD